MTAPHVSEPQDAPPVPLWAWALSGVLLAIAACWAVWRWE